MNFIFEGPDNAGKTSLAQTVLRSVHGMMYHHPGGAPANPAAEDADMVAQFHMLSWPYSHVFMDRVTCISQQVYNPSTERDPARRQMVQQILPHAVVIYCRPPNEVLMDVGNYTWRAEETEEHRQKIMTRAHEFIERYDMVMTGIPCISYNFRDVAHAEVIRNMLNRAACGDTGAQMWFKEVITCGGAR